MLVKTYMLTCSQSLLLPIHKNISHPGCKCPDLYTGVHCELLKRVRSDQNDPSSRNPAGDETTDSAIIFTLLLLSIVLLVLTGAIVYRSREKKKIRRRRLHRDHIEQSRIKDSESNMEQLAFQDEPDEDISDADMEEVELL